MNGICYVKYDFIEFEVKLNFEKLFLILDGFLFNIFKI